MEIQNLNQLLAEEMRDLYDAEKRLVKALPKMIKAAISSDLKNAIEEHLEQTQNQVTRLERAFEMLGEKPRAKTCEAMKGLIEEGEETITSLQANDQFLDLALIAAAQKVEHYEMAGYGTLRAWADRLDLPEVSALFQQTFEEERNADRELTQISERLIREVITDGNRKPAASHAGMAEARRAGGR